MEPLDQPKTLTVFMLLKQFGLSLCPVGVSSVGLNTGFFLDRNSAEYARTMAMLGDSNANQSFYHIFELKIPNPAYQEYRN